MICSTCNEYIIRGEKTSHGPDGQSHVKCVKQATMTGREVDLFSLLEEIGWLKKRVQELEQIVSNHERNIDFRIG